MALWQVSAATGWVRSDNWPSLRQIAVALVGETFNGDLVPALGQTAGLVLLGFAIGAFGGIGAGVLASLNSTARTVLATVVELFRPIPVPALVPPLVLLFGTELHMKLVAVSFSALFPIFLNTVAGIAGIDPQLRLVARTLHLDGFGFIRDIVLPGALPSIFSGLRIGFGISLVVAVTVEMIVGGSGVGSYLLTMQFAARPAEMYAAIVALMAFSYASSISLKKLEVRCIFWRSIDR